MKVVRHAVSHAFIHLALFSGFALLVPVITTALEQKADPWVLSPTVFFAGVMLVIISAFLLYRVKESISGLMQSLGAMIFIPGALTVVSQVFSVKSFIESASSVSGMAVLKPLSAWYVDHSIPAVLGVAASYLLIGGVLYWMGAKLQKLKEKLWLD